ncbi:FecR family protein [Belliella pelovolcani]|uniref:FecR family protein n=1 Tax=Belliella pelovolcani TaxID=529505 RepID=A0A1N7PNP8_9BACT|nr:FecR family protein [Belliella pelovolcani]SIT12202.1 FecR family protein [Belliella pelovolcani]
MKAKFNIDPETKALIHQLLRGKITNTEELNRINEWYHKIYQEQSSTLDTKQYKREALQMIDKAIKTKQRNLYVRFRWIAATITLIALTAIALFQISDWSSTKDPSDVEWVVYQTGKGERATYYLPDSSQVFLAPNTTIKITTDFLAQRKVELNGLAFFKVKKLQQTSFEVFTEKLHTSVLGTSFSVGAYSGGEERVEVKSGKVKVKQQEGSKQTILAKGQRVYTFQDQLFPSTITDQEEAFSWVSNTLIFNNITLSEMAEKLEDWYGIEVKTTQPFNTCRINGKYQNQSIEEVLKIINYSIKMEYKWENNTLTIEKVTCN